MIKKEQHSRLDSQYSYGDGLILIKDCQLYKSTIILKKGTKVMYVKHSIRDNTCNIKYNGDFVSVPYTSVMSVAEYRNKIINDL